MESPAVRPMRLPFPDRLDPLLIPSEPEESYFSIAFSLLLPYLEPYLIRTMKEAQKQIPKEQVELHRGLTLFIGQEGQHYQQHRRFNDTVRHGFPKLAEFEAELEAEYRKFSEERSLRFNLAYAESFEAVALATGCHTLGLNRLVRLSQPARDLMQWHLMEEIEHRTVAFDVYQAICPGYFYRFWASLVTHKHIFGFFQRVTGYMLEADPELLPRFGGKAGQRKRMMRLLKEMGLSLLPKVLFTYTPWYNPRKVVIPEVVAEFAAIYSEMVRKSPATSGSSKA